MIRKDFLNGVNDHDGTETSLRTADMDSSLRTTRGYDDVTGIGTPRGKFLIRALKHR